MSAEVGLLAAAGKWLVYAVGGLAGYIWLDTKSKIKKIEGRVEDTFTKQETKDKVKESYDQLKHEIDRQRDEMKEILVMLREVSTAVNQLSRDMAVLNALRGQRDERDR